MNIIKFKILSLIIITTLLFSGCTFNTKLNNQPSKKDLPKHDTKTITGTIIDTSDNSIFIKSLEGNGNEFVVHINEKTTYENGISQVFAKGNLVVIEFDGTTMESMPIQISASKILANEPNQEIQVDEKEIVSELLNGKYPIVILDKNTRETEINTNEPFAIKLEENPSTGYRYICELSSINIQQIGEEFIELNPATLGSPGIHYWGFEISQKGEYFINFKLISPSNEVKEEVNFQIFTVDENDTGFIECTGNYLEYENETIKIEVEDMIFLLYAPNFNEIEKNIFKGDTVYFKAKKGESGYILEKIEKKRKYLTFQGIIENINDIEIMTVSNENTLMMFAITKESVLPDDLKIGDKVEITYYADYVSETTIITEIKHIK